MNYILVKATPQDEDWVNNLTRATMKPYVESSWTDLKDQEYYYHLNRFDLAHTSIIFVKEKKAGRLTISQDDTVLTLEDLHLLPEFHGRGLGTKIIKDVIEQAFASGLAVELKCLKTNPVSNLYNRLGFKLIKADEKRLYYKIEKSEID